MSERAPQAACSQRAGKSAAPLVLTLTGLTGLIALLAIWLGGGDSDGVADTPRFGIQREQRVSELESGAASARAENERFEAVTGPVFAAEGGVEIRYGVRLPGPGQLLGRVVDHESGRGIPNARVELLALPPPGANLMGRVFRLAGTSDDFAARAQPVAVTGSDSAGNFAFEGIREGRYFLDARAAHHVALATPQVRVTRSGAGGPIDVWVRPGGRLFGRVLMPDGAPARSGKVAAVQGIGSLLEAARNGELRYIEADIGPEGEFLLAGMPPGEGFEVTAMGSGFALTHVTDVVVEEGKDRFLEIQTRSGGAIEGRVVSMVKTEDGGEELRPLAGAHVGAVPRGMRDLMYVEELLLESHVITGVNGRFRIENAPPGEVDVMAIAEGHLAAKSGVMRLGENSHGDAGDLRLKRGATVRVRVLDSAGQAIVGAHARWDMVDWDSFEFDLTLAPMLAQAVEGFDFPSSDADGWLTAGPFANDEPHRFEVHRAGFESVRERWDPEQGDELEVVMIAGGAVEGIVMDLDAATPLTLFEVTGGDRIDQQADTPGSENPFSGGQLFETPDGRFRIEGVEVGSSKLTFRADGYLRKTVDVEVTEGGVTRGVIVQLTRGGVVRGTVVDPEGKPVGGARVLALDADGRALNPDGRRGRRRRGGPFGDGNMPPGAVGIATGLGLLDGLSALSEPDGSFELTGLDAAAFSLLATARGWCSGTSDPLNLSEEGLLEGVELMLSEGGGVHGTVRDRFGRPVPGALMLAISPEDLAGSANSGGAYDARTDEAGDYEIAPMEPGAYFLALARGDDGLSVLSILGTLNFDMVTVPDGERVRYDITDTSAGACRVYGMVTAQGEPLTQGIVMALGLESENMLGVDMKIAQIRRDGSYSFPGLSPGEYTFQIQARGPEMRVGLEVPDLPEFRYDIASPTGGLEGRVVDAQTGEPVDRAEIQLLGEGLDVAPDGLLAQLIARESGVERTYSDGEEGAFRFGALQEGSYELQVIPPRWGDQQGRYAPVEPMRIDIVEGVVQGDLELRLEPTLVLSGLVRDSEGMPVAGARVRAHMDGQISLRPPTTRSDEEGRYELRDLRGGGYTLVASHEDFADTHEEGVEIDAQASDQTRDLVLRRGVEVSVLALTASGTPAPGAIARLILVGGAAHVTDDAGDAIEGVFRGESVADADGRIQLGSFSPGEYRLEVVRAGSRAEQEGIVLLEGPPVELMARLE